MAMIDGEKVLVTGPTGNLALPIVRRLAATNEVWGLARFSRPGERDRLEAMGVVCVRHDLGRDTFDDLPRDFGYVLHAGGLIPMASERDWAYTFEVNAQGTGRLMSHCRQARGFVYLSTGGVYQPRVGVRLVEGDPLGGNVPAYCLSKIAGEAVARFAAAEWHIPTAILRMGAYFGLESGGPAVELVDRVARGKDIWVHPGRPNNLTLLWEDDAVDQGIRALTVGEVPALVMNWGSGETVGIEEYCTAAGELVGRPPRFVSTEKAYPGVYLDTALAEARLGRCQVPWPVALRRLVAARYPNGPGLGGLPAS